MLLLAAGYCLIYGGLSGLTNEFILTDNLMRQDWAATYDESQLEVMLVQRRKWTLVGYAILPVVLGLKIFFTGFCVMAASILVDWEIDFRDVIEVAVQAELVFVAAAICQFLWALFLLDIQSLSDYMAFYPLSALALVKLDSSQLWMAYALKSMNVFEVGYVTALCWGLVRISKDRVSRVVTIVTSGYGTGLLLLICAVTFLSLFVL